MFMRPSSRRKTHNEPVQLNLVPMMDAFVTLIAFLLYSMAFLSLVVIESPLPQASSEEIVKKLQEKPLQLTVSVQSGKTEIWSPFGKIDRKTIPHLPDGEPDLLRIHETLLDIKRLYPTEEQLVFAPHRALNYEAMINLLDQFRLLQPTDSPIFVKSAQTGVEESIHQLFPKVVFGNLLSENSDTAEGS